MDFRKKSPKLCLQKLKYKLGLNNHKRNFNIIKSDTDKPHVYKNKINSDLQFYYKVKKIVGLLKIVNIEWCQNNSQISILEKQ